MTTSSPPTAGVDKEENWHTPKSDDVWMRDPGSVTGKRIWDDQSPEEERGRGVTRSIKQEMIEELTPPQADKRERKQNEIINLTNTDEEIDSNEEQEEDLEKEDNSEESSDNLCGNENSDSSAGSEETPSKEDMTHKGRKEVQEEDKSSSKESHSDNEVEVILVTLPTKKSRTVIKESKNQATKTLKTIAMMDMKYLNST